jgi:ubiquinone/menaquinone biosynthesis C-methylase UbiE
VIEAQIHHHYTTRHDEAQRLSSTLKGQLECERVHEMLTQYLPEPPSRVIDIGGGPGTHAAWLQTQGYIVELVDPVQHHVEQARRAGIQAVVGDARKLPWGNETFDAALLAGPLYHLTEAADRRLALREAVRVVRPGGVIAVIAINRVANLIGSTLANRLPQRREVVEEILDNGYSPRNERLVNAHYHTTTQLRTELTAVGLQPVTIHGLTGPGGWLTVVIDAHFKDQPLPESFRCPDPLQTALTCARIADGWPELVPSSSLLFGVGRRP